MHIAHCTATAVTHASHDITYSTLVNDTSDITAKMDLTS